MPSKTAVLLDSLMARGFDRSYISGRSVHVGCSQCAAVAICGIACHETGCPNQTHECDECGQPIPKRQRICEDCATVEYEPVLDE